MSGVIHVPCYLHSMKINQISETIYKDPDRASHSNNGNNHHSHHQSTNQTSSSSVHYNVNVRFDPITPIAGKTTELVLSITDQKIGDPIKEFPSSISSKLLLGGLLMLQKNLYMMKNIPSDL